MTLAVKVALNPNTTNQSVLLFFLGQKDIRGVPMVSTKSIISPKARKLVVAMCPFGVGPFNTGYNVNKMNRFFKIFLTKTILFGGRGGCEIWLVASAY